MGDPDWNSGFYLDWYPETVQLTTSPNGMKSAMRYSVPWLQFLRAMQPNTKAAVFITRMAGGLFNNHPDNADIPILELDQLEVEPLAESISSGGNVVKILEIQRGSGLLEMLYIKGDPPSLAEVNYQETPWLVTKFTSVSSSGQLGNVAGIDVYFPNVSNLPEGSWVDMQRVELFPALPMCVVARRGVPIVNTRMGLAKQVALLEPGDAIAILEYAPQGSDVWALTELGWLRLAFQNDALPTYTTSWEMETRPPIMLGR